MLDEPLALEVIIVELNDEIVSGIDLLLIEVVEVGLDILLVPLNKGEMVEVDEGLDLGILVLVVVVVLDNEMMVGPLNVEEVEDEDDTPQLDAPDQVSIVVEIDEID